MKSKNNYFKYKTSNGWSGGYFNIYQARNGSIFLMMANSFTVLSVEQVEKLHLDVYALKDFNHDLFLKFYGKE